MPRRPPILAAIAFVSVLAGLVSAARARQDPPPEIKRIMEKAKRGQPPTAEDLKKIQQWSQKLRERGALDGSFEGTDYSRNDNGSETRPAASDAYNGPSYGIPFPMEKDLADRAQEEQKMPPVSKGIAKAVIY